MSLQHWHRYAALGSADVPAVEGSVSPWTDRLAAILRGTAQLRGELFEYSNFSTGDDAISRQTFTAINLGADLASIVISNSSLVKSDPLTLTSAIDSAVGRLKSTGCEVLLATTMQPRRTLPLGPLRERAARFTAELWNVARHHDAFTLDLWNTRGFTDAGLWMGEAGTLSAQGSRQVASHAARALGIGYYESVAFALLDGDESIPALSGRPGLKLVPRLD